MVCFSVSERLCDWTYSSTERTENNKSNCCQFRHNLLIILDIRMIEGAMATAGSAAFPTFLVSNFCKYKQSCRWIRVKRIASFAGLLMKCVKVLDIWYLFLCCEGCWKRRTFGSPNESKKGSSCPKNQSQFGSPYPNHFKQSKTNVSRFYFHWSGSSRV